MNQDQTEIQNLAQSHLVNAAWFFTALNRSLAQDGKGEVICELSFDGPDVIAELREKRNLRRRRFLRLAIALLIDAAIAGAFYAIFNLIWR